MNKDYSGFSVLDFINDVDFQDWIIMPNAEKENYWQKIILENPDLQADIKNATYFLQSITFKESWPREEEIEKGLQKALKKIKQNEQTAPLSVFNKKNISRVFLAAAAIFLLFGLSYWFLTGYTGQKEKSIVKNKIEDQVIPGGNKAILTLADGSTLLLDSAHNGALATQGSVTVIKLDDGQLSYKGAGNKGQIVYNTISTPKGGQYQLVLADGTKVWLNAASSLRFPTAFVEKERKVELSGEGYFEVAKDASKPFHVKVGNMNVNVLGTHFNINGYADEDNIETTLLEGQVTVNSQETVTVLTPGQQAQLHKASGKVKKLQHVNMGEIMAWKEGHFLFKGVSIESILRQASRWYDVDIVYQGKIDETFSGGISRSENISELLKILAATDKIEFKINGRQIIVKPKS